MEQLTLEEASEEYKAFVDKFKPKLTTDDCYTPPEHLRNGKRVGVRALQP